MTAEDPNDGGTWKTSAIIDLNSTKTDLTTVSLTPVNTMLLSIVSIVCGKGVLVGSVVGKLVGEIDGVFEGETVGDVVGRVNVIGGAELRQKNFENILSIFQKLTIEFAHFIHQSRKETWN